MKQVTKKIMSIALALIVTFSFLQPLQVSAEESNTLTTKDFGEPISVTTYEDEELGCMVTEKIYFMPSTNARDTSGSGTYRNEKTFTWTSGIVSTYYAQGFFTWGNGDVEVSDAEGGFLDVPVSCEVSNTKLENGTGRYVGIFNKYAYVTFSCTVTNPIGLSSDLSVTIRVSESGNQI